MLSTNGRQDIKKTLVHSCLLQHHSRVWNLGVTRVGTWSHVWGSLLLGLISLPCVPPPNSTFPHIFVSFYMASPQCLGLPLLEHQEVP
jgi:hypothetical protein